MKANYAKIFNNDSSSNRLEKLETASCFFVLLQTTQKLKTFHNLYKKKGEDPMR